ncbi:MAG: gluzincin family metallopeptidase [Elusimicrobiales bacterium]
MKRQWLGRVWMSAALTLVTCQAARAGQVFVSSESPHFVFSYVRGGAAERDLALIAAARERAYDVITVFLGVPAGDKIKIAFYPDRESALSGGGAGVTTGDTISVVYFGFSPCYEKVSYGHELVHALSYRLLGGRHSVPLLAEGIAEYLDQSGRNLHEWLSYKSRILGYGGRFRVEAADLAYGDGLSSLSYTKSGSFVKWLVESGGREKFLKLYALTWRTGALSHRERLDAFKDKFSEVYGTSLEDGEAGWNAAVSAFGGKDLPRLPALEEVEVRELFSAQDAAVAAKDAGAFVSTYDRLGRRKIRYFDGNLAFYMEKLLKTRVEEVYDLGVKNGRRALVRVKRRFSDLTTRRIDYYVEKLEDGWKVQGETWK